MVLLAGKNLAENHNAPVALREKLGLELIEINEILRRILLPVRAPFLEILAGELLENQAAQNVIGGRVIDVVGRDDVILFRAMLELDVERAAACRRAECEAPRCRRR